MRSEVVRVRNAEFVEAAFGSGGTFGRVLLAAYPAQLADLGRSLYRRCSSAGRSCTISTLGFLGYGAPPPTPEWGLLIAEGRNYLAHRPVADRPPPA